MRGDIKKLRELYPTIISYESAFAKFKTKQEFADHLGVGTEALYKHQKWLHNGKPPIMPKDGKYKEADTKTIIATIKTMGEANGRKNEVKIYKLTGEYQSGQVGHEGLEYVGVEKGLTWAEAVEIHNSKRRNHISAWELTLMVIERR